MKLSLISATVAFLFAASAPAPAQQGNKAAIVRSVTAAEYDVFLAVMGGKEDFVVVNKASLSGIGPWTPGDLQRMVPGLSSGLYEKYITANKEPAAVEAKFPVSGSYTVIGRKELDHFFGKNGVEGWRAFHAKFPKSGGYYMFSRVGLDGDRAFLFASHYCGSLCADGTFYLLTKENGRWRVSTKHTLWVS